MRTLVTPAPIEADVLFAAFQADNPQAGAIAAFVGQVRPGVDALELEIYDGMTQTQVATGLAPIAATVDGFYAVHRFGRLTPGETIVVVLAAAAHRRAAFEAVDQAMDWLKTEAAFWKKETVGGRSRWIEPRAADYTDAQRWRRA
jgi:molybdopterin synthase catalytic subunit